jgi:hypothetical protein
VKDQWSKKRQTKEQKAAATRAKLDPNSAKSAKDVMDERVRKRKLEELEREEGSDIEGIEKELPGQGLKKAQDKKMKKQKTSQELEPSQPSIATIAPKISESEKRQLKAEKKLQKKAKELEKKEGKKLKVAKQAVQITADKDIQGKLDSAGVEKEPETVDEELASENEISNFDAEGLEEPEPKDSTASPSPEVHSPTFDIHTEPSTNTSEASVVPPATAPKHIKLPTDPELLRARLAARIDALRAARKADGPDGAPARNRQELMEARRKKEEQRKAHKKELRVKAKLEEEARREAALISARDSPASMMSPSIHSTDTNNFSFGRVQFADGQQLSENLSTLLAAPKKKGPQDPATALQASEKKRLRVAGFDEEKRADIEEKDMWLNAKKRAHGEKVRDDSSMLKKTLKRKEKAKKKSEKEWNERKESQAKGTAMKQKKREENLKARRDGSNKGKGKGKSAGVKKGKPKVKSRPGFEGSFGSGKRK